MTRTLGPIGFVGLGLMGLPMARNLAAAGADLTVYNRTAAKAQALVSDGARLAESVEYLADAVQGGIVVICVSDTPAMEATIAGLTSRDLTGTLLIDMGTTTVKAIQAASAAVAAKGGSFVDAPVSGGAVGAADGTLSIMAGGQTADIERAMPLFRVIGKATTHVGPVGAGQVAKAANQAIVGATLSIIGETMVLAQKAGCDTAKMREALLGGFAGSRLLDLHGQRMIDRTFEPGGRARTQAKDLAQTVELAQSLGLKLPVLEQNFTLWQEMVTRGMGDLDQSGYLVFAEALQGD
jgi:2-hydroxy-3-oxopropionate reductase